MRIQLILNYLRGAIILLLLNTAFCIDVYATTVDLVSADSCVPENSFYGMPLVYGGASNMCCRQSYKVERYQIYSANVDVDDLEDVIISCTMLLKHRKDRIRIYGWFDDYGFARIPRTAVSSNLGSGWYQHTYEYTINDSDLDELEKMYIYNPYHQDILLNELECVAKPTFGNERYVLINEEINNSYTVNEKTELPTFSLDVTHRQEARLLKGDKVKLLLSKESGVADYLDISCRNINIRYADSSDVGSLIARCEEHDDTSIPTVENISGKDILSIEYFLDIGFEVNISDEATSDILNEVFKIVPVFE